jgi:hypothetical protein
VKNVSRKKTTDYQKHTIRYLLQLWSPEQGGFSHRSSLPQQVVPLLLDEKALFPLIMTPIPLPIRRFTAPLHSGHSETGSSSMF